MITAILLASGFSQRMGQDKLLLNFHGQPLIEWMMQAIASCPFDQQLLVQREELYTPLCRKYNFDSIHNPQADLGQSKAIHFGTLAAPAENALMFFTGDQPLLSPLQINRLLTQHRLAPDVIILPVIRGQHRSPVIFPCSLRDELLHLDGDHGGRAVIQRHPELIQAIPFDTDLPFRDIDTMADYEQLIAAYSNDCEA